MTITRQIIKRTAAHVAAGSNLKPLSTFARPSGITATSAERPIPREFNKSDWYPIGAVLSPLLPLALLIGIPYTRQATIDFATANWGSIASVWGLGVSIYVLFVAKGARRAAEDARSAERLRTVLEELEDAAKKCTELGQFARAQKWDLVHLRAQEVMASCRVTVARWGEDAALKDHRNKVLQVATFMRSIVEETNKDTVSQKTISDAQLNSDEKLTAVVGKIHREQESGSK